MYVLYVDESGSHGLFQNNKAYVLAGVAIHEADIRPLGDRLRDVVLEVVPDEATVARYELHAAELRRPPPESPWKGIDGQVRRRTLERALRAIGSFEEHDDPPEQAFRRGGTGHFANAAAMQAAMVRALSRGSRPSDSGPPSGVAASPCIERMANRQLSV